MSEELTLRLEDGYFAGTSVVFIKTVTDHLFISVNDEYGLGKNTIILREDDVPILREFLAQWDTEVIDVG